MNLVPLQAIPNQSFTIILDNNTWDFTIKTTKDVMSISLNLNGDGVIENARAVAGSLIIPARYQESGNFLFVTQNYELPYYTKFNVTQSLVYVTADELASYREQPTPPITASYFNPIADLPQRFAPQGY